MGTSRGIPEKQDTKKIVMSDSIKKWHEMKLDESFNDKPLEFQTSEEKNRKQAYQILLHYSEASIRIANEILNGIEKH
jgi:hypothetical protein